MHKIHRFRRVLLTAPWHILLELCARSSLSYTLLLHGFFVHGFSIWDEFVLTFTYTGFAQPVTDSQAERCLPLLDYAIA